MAAKPRNPYADQTSAGYAGNLGRSVLEGLTFNNAAELEAAIRAAAGGDMSRYRQLKQAIDQNYGQWGEQHVAPRMAGELGGAAIPGLVGAFIPGGQGATLGAVSRGARMAAEPLTVLAERYAPRMLESLTQRAPRLMNVAMPLADEMVTGALQAVGSAPTIAEAPRTVVEEAPLNLGLSLVSRGLTDRAKRALAVRRARKRVD